MRRDREFYPLADLAACWGCSVADLLHLGMQRRVQICANVFGRTSMVISTREENLPQIDDWTTSSMPPGIYKMTTATLRGLDAAGSCELQTALKFDAGGWWKCNFRTLGVEVEVRHLVMLREEVARVDVAFFNGAGARVAFAQVVGVAADQDAHALAPGDLPHGSPPSLRHKKGTRWTVEDKAALKRYKELHGEQAAASHFGIHRSRVGAVLASAAPKEPLPTANHPFPQAKRS